MALKDKCAECPLVEYCTKQIQQAQSDDRPERIKAFELILKHTFDNCNSEPEVIEKGPEFLGVELPTIEIPSFIGAIVLFEKQTYEVCRAPGAKYIPQSVKRIEK